MGGCAGKEKSKIEQEPDLAIEELGDGEENDHVTQINTHRSGHQRGKYQKFKSQATPRVVRTSHAKQIPTKILIPPNEEVLLLSDNLKKPFSIFRKLKFFSSNN